MRSGQSATQLLFEEWSTSGQRNNRPTIGYLRDLLVQTEMFRAADYVAVNLLNEEPPPRPLTGPAARVDITLPDEEFEEMLNGFDYPGSNLSHVNSDHIPNNNRDFFEKQHHAKLKVTQIHADNSHQHHDHNQHQAMIAKVQVEPAERSDMIKFSNANSRIADGAIGGNFSIDESNLPGNSLLRTNSQDHISDVEVSINSTKGAISVQPESNIESSAEDSGYNMPCINDSINEIMKAWDGTEFLFPVISELISNTSSALPPSMLHDSEIQSQESEISRTSARSEDESDKVSSSDIPGSHIIPNLSILGSSE